MTVAEMIEALSAFPPDQDVYSWEHDQWGNPYLDEVVVVEWDYSNDDQVVVVV
jgi:hypothetical protein